MPYFTYMWNLRNRTNEEAKQRQTHRHGEQTSGCHRRERGRWMDEIGIRAEN